MELFIKKKKHTIKDKFEITDENGNIIYKATSELISIGNKLHIYDKDNKEVSVINERMGIGRKKYSIELADRNDDLEVIRKHGNSEHPEFSIKELSWEAKGNFKNHNYSIDKGMRKIADINPKLLAIGDMMRIDIKDGIDLVMALSLVLVCELETAED